MIGAFPREGCATIKTPDAFCWLEAKKLFGYELSGLQNMLLEMKRKKQPALKLPTASNP